MAIEPNLRFKNAAIVSTRSGVGLHAHVGPQLCAVVVKMLSSLYDMTVDLLKQCIDKLA